MQPQLPTDAELEQLLSELESDLVERKQAFTGEAADTVRQAVCAFGNDLPNHRRAGVIVIGAKDDGSPAGLAVTDQLLLQLADIRSDGNIVPLPTLFVEKRRLLGADMAAVMVFPSDSTPLRYKGRIYIRTGPRRGIASAQDERLLNEKRRFRDLPFDLSTVPSAKLTDLSRLRFLEEYLPAAFAPDILEANDRSYEDRLAACRMIEGVDSPVPTLTGCVVLCERAADFIPAACIQFVRFLGTDMSSGIADEARLSGPLSQMLRRIDEKLESYIRVPLDIVSGPLESREPEYPLAALQQLVRNAVMHRTYEATNRPIQGSWFADRIEISNPGGPFGVVTRETFGKPGYNDYRNPNIAEAMKVLGFVQKFGVGIQLARQLLRSNNHPELQFEINERLVVAIVKARG